jgi:hypothetical protein
VKEQQRSQDWRAYLKTVVVEPIWTLFTTGIFVTVLYVGTWWRDNFGSEAWVKRLQLKYVLPHWHPVWWVSIGLVVVLFAIVRASHRLYADQIQEVMSLRKALADRQFEPLPVTSPQVRLIAESEPGLGQIDGFLLTNVSTSQMIFNIIFQPVRLENGIFVVWHPQSIDILEPRQGIDLRPLVLATKDGSQTGPCDSLSGVAALHRAIKSRSKASNAYDIGKIAFTCEDTAQQRYLVTVRVAINFLGSNITVTDIDRVRIGSRPTIHPSS